MLKEIITKNSNAGNNFFMDALQHADIAAQILNKHGLQILSIDVVSQSKPVITITPPPRNTPISIFGGIWMATLGSHKNICMASLYGCRIAWDARAFDTQRINKTIH